MKENVIIGKLIPAGTGMKRYRNVKLNTDRMMMELEELNDIEEFETVEIDEIENAVSETILELDAENVVEFSEEENELEGINDISEE